METQEEKEGLQAREMSRTPVDIKPSPRGRLLKEIAVYELLEKLKISYLRVDHEVYAFSSFCTALVVWLILKWENRADLPYSDRYLVLIAYVIGISIAVHLLNLL